MVSQSEFPESWNEECEQKRVKVEVAMTDESNYTSGIESGNFEWIEVPTSDVESWVTRSENNGDLKRTNRITFPTEWDGESVVDAFRGRDNFFMFGRVSYKNASDNYITQSVGYIDGIGGTQNPLESKALIRDFSEFVSSVGITTSFQSPTPQTVLSTVGQAINEQTPVPIVDAKIIPPNFSQEFNETDIELLAEGVELQSNDYNSPLLKEGVFNTQEEFAESNYLAEPLSDGLFDDFIISVPNNILGFNISTKQFREERHTIADILEWLTSKLGARWFFEPSESGVTLVIDVESESRTFVGESVLDAAAVDSDTVESVTVGEDYSYFSTVEVIQNDALNQIGPVNSMKVKGTSKRSTFGLPTTGIINPSKEYPVATASSERLIEAANDTVITDTVVETDATTTGEAEGAALRELYKRITSVDNGEIRMLGNPLLLPNDRIDAFEVCNDFVDVEELPVSYQIEEVHHTAPSTGFYRTEVRVGIYVDTSRINISSSMVTPNALGDPNVEQVEEETITE